METATNNQRQKSLVLLAWVLLLLLAWSLWLYHLDSSDLTFDETATYSVAHQPFLKILGYLREAVREHPPVYYLLMHVWMMLAGTGEFSLRFPSVGAGMVALALTGWLARVAMRRSAVAGSLVAALLLVATPGMAYRVRDARMYSLGIVWTLLSAGLFLRDWLPTKKWPSRVALASLAAVHLMALFTHYYLLLLILVQPLALLIARRWRPLLAWCALHVLPALAGLAWLWLSPGLQMTAGSLFPHLASSAPTRFEIFHLLGKILFSPVMEIRFTLLYRLLLLIGGGVLVALYRRRTVGAWLALTLILPLALAHALPLSPAPRYLVFLISPAVLALAFLCVTPLRLIKHRWLAWGATVGLTLVGAWLLAAGGLYDAILFDRSNYGRTLETIQAHVRSGDGLLFYGPWQRSQFEYYDPGNMPPHTSLPRHAPPHLDPDEARPVLESLMTKYDRLWVLPAAVSDVDPERFVEGWLRTHAHKVWDTGYFSLYLPPLPPDAPSQSVQMTFGDVLLLESIAWEPEQVLEGEPLRLTLLWKSLRQLEDDVRLTLKLTDETGHVWAHDYSMPGMWAYPPSQWGPGEVITDYEGLMIPWGAPPGEYTLRLRVTQESSGQILAAGEAEEVDLLTVTVGEMSEPVQAPALRADLDHRLYLPLIARTVPDRRPVLHGLPNANAATFCPPSGGDCLNLAGYEPGGLRFQQGYQVPLTLHWLSPEHSLPELDLRLRVVHCPWLGLPGLSETYVLTRTLSLAPTYPAPLWSPRRLVTLPDALTLPPEAPTGLAWVTLEVLGPDGLPWPTAEGDTTLSLFKIIVEGRPVLRRLPNDLTPVQADFGTEIGLRGYQVEGDPHPGGQLHLTYAWYARTRPTAIYAIFNHLVAPDGSIVAQADGWPQGGLMLTTQWQPGEYVEDSYTLTIPSDALPGPYTLYVGVYDAANDERQSAFQDGQRLPADRLTIPLPGEEEQ